MDYTPRAWDDDPPPRSWTLATPAHLDRVALASPDDDNDDDDEDDDGDQLDVLDRIAADHLSPSDRLLYWQCLRSGLPVGQVASGVGLAPRKARERLVSITGRLRILAHAPPLPTLADALDALGHADEEAAVAVWLHSDFRSGRHVARVMGIAPQRVSEAIRRGLALLEEGEGDVAEAVLTRVAYRRESGWTGTAAARSKGRRAFERMME